MLTNIGLPTATAEMVYDEVDQISDPDIDYFYHPPYFQPIPQNPKLLGEANYDDRNSFALGVCMIFEAVVKVLKAKQVPDVVRVSEEITRMVQAGEKFEHGTFEDDLMCYQDYGGDLDMALEALFQSAKSDWEHGDLKDLARESRGFRKLPKCKVHDFDWGLVEDLLLG